MQTHSGFFAFFLELEDTKTMARTDLGEQTVSAFAKFLQMLLQPLLQLLGNAKFAERESPFERDEATGFYVCTDMRGTWDRWHLKTRSHDPHMIITWCCRTRRVYVVGF